MREPKEQIELTAQMLFGKSLDELTDDEHQAVNAEVRKTCEQEVRDLLDEQRRR